MTNPKPNLSHIDTLAATSNLTNSQLQIWLGQKLNPEVPLYNMVMAFTIMGEIQPDAFRCAFQTLIDRSDALRTVIAEVNGIPQRRVFQSFVYEVEILDFSEESDPKATYQTWVDQRRVFQFNLAECLFDSALIRLAQDKFIWYLNQHHLFTDGWSVALVYRRMAEFYQLALDGQLTDAADLPSFQNYADFEREYRQSAKSQQARTYWQERAKETPEPLRLYGNPPSPESTHTERVFCDLGRKRTEKLKAIAMEKGFRSLMLDLSLFNIFVTLLFAYLHRISGDRHLAIGTPSHNRPSAEFKEMIGLFIELFPLQIEFDEDETFLSLFQKVMGETYDFLRYAQPCTSSPESSRVYNVVLNYINAAFTDFNGLPMQSEWVHPGAGDKGHSLRLQVHDFDASGSFQLHFDFNCDVFDEAQRGLAVQHFLRVVDSFIENRTQPIERVSLLSDGEHQRYLVEFNQTAAEYPSHQTVVQLFEAQAEKTPHAVALGFGQETMTYRELNAQANRVAHYLQKHGANSETIVGICTRRSPEMLVAILGVLKAGSAYLPIDPNYPKNRIAFMLEETRAPVLLTQKALVERLPEHHATIICLDTDWQTISTENRENLNCASPDTLAYIIYTSGSTGQPKGVKIQHRSLMNYICWAKKQYLRGETLDFPLYSSFAFDLTVTSIFVPLISGGQIVIYREDDTDRDLAILRVVEADAVDVLKLTPSHLSLIQGMIGNTSRLKKLIVGGEDLKTDLARAITDVRDDIEIYNEYGPTEATVGCMIHRFDPEKDLAASVPIGTPAGNSQIYLLDDNLTPVPTGVAGEMYISGDGVASGYFNRPDLTRERFLPNPFAPEWKMYRTGDLARWKSDGGIEFLGRADHQVKIGGARIELGEVEAALLAHEKIGECAVDVFQYALGQEVPAQLRHCVMCGIPSNHPEATLNARGVCNLCVTFEGYKSRALQYFKTMDDLRAIFEPTQKARRGEYDCLMLLSGGKDSTYALYQLVEMGLKPLVFSLDNGYISDGAKANIRRAVDELGLELIFGETPTMNAIFVDSLKSHSNVCNGCFKTIYTLSMNLARERGIRYIVTGLSRGQIFETRLAPLFHQGIFDVKKIDQAILDARKAYHRMDDVIARSLDVEIFKDDATFDEIQFIDFYRYCDVELNEVLRFLNTHAPWIRPEDTGRSTNCLINEVGIYVHKQERGYHNYALPYSWDVRLGHKTRAETLAELDDDIDERRVKKILHEIGYEPKHQTRKSLVAYYVSEHPLTVSELRAHLSQRLPDYMIPSDFVQLDEIPLTGNGKVDRQALPLPDNKRPTLKENYVVPRTPLEKKLVQIWSDVLRREQIGVHDNFIELGGDSILNIQIIARASQAGLRLTPKQLFDHPTVAELATVADMVPTLEAEQGLVTGSVPLTPIQHRFFEWDLLEPQHWNHAVMLETSETLDPGLLEQTIERLLFHHDALRLRFVQNESGWEQFCDGFGPPPPAGNAGKSVDVPLTCIDLSDVPEAEQETAIENVADELHKSLDLSTGRLMQTALFERGAGRPSWLLIVIHHLAVDVVSWWFLLEDLETVYHQLRRGEAISLPPKTTAFKTWAEALTKYATSGLLEQERDYWLTHAQGKITPLPIDASAVRPNIEALSRTISVSLNLEETEALLQDVPGVYNTKVDEVLLTALVASVSAWTGLPSLTVDLEGHGRENIIEGVDVSRTVGWFTTVSPVTLSLDGISELDNALKSIKEQLRTIPNRGIGYGLLRYLSGDADLKSALENGGQPEILFNYLGRFDRFSDESSIFKLMGELTLSRSPQNRRIYPLEVNAFIVEGALRVDWTYSEQTHQQTTIERLATDFMEILRLLIEHCLSAEAGGYTPSDFPEADLNQEELDDLIAEFSEPVD